MAQNQEVENINLAENNPLQQGIDRRPTAPGMTVTPDPQISKHEGVEILEELKAKAPPELKKSIQKTIDNLGENLTTGRPDDLPPGMTIIQDYHVDPQDVIDGLNDFMTLCSPEEQLHVQNAIKNFASRVGISLPKTR
jgi:hypothetical protein